MHIKSWPRWLKQVAESNGPPSCSQEGESGTLSFSPALRCCKCIFAWGHWVGHNWNCRSFLALSFQKAPTPCSCWHLSHWNRAASLLAYLTCADVLFSWFEQTTSQVAALFILRWGKETALMQMRLLNGRAERSTERALCPPWVSLWAEMLWLNILNKVTVVIVLQTWCSRGNIWALSLTFSVHLWLVLGGEASLQGWVVWSVWYLPCCWAVGPEGVSVLKCSL